MRYFLLTLKHKLFVFIEGLRVGVPIWQLIIHDWSKLLPWDCYQYNKQFFGKKDSPYDFIWAWIRHQNRHPHHWEYWIPRTGHNRCTPPYPDNKPIPMQVRYIREMIADWLGAGWAYNKKRVNLNNWEWFNKNKTEMNMHDTTWVLLYQIIEEIKRRT